MNDAALRAAAALTCDASDLARIEHARFRHAQFLKEMQELLPLASFEAVRDRLHDNIEDLTFDARRIYDRAPQRPAHYAPTRDDPPAVRQFDADVERHKALLMRAVQAAE